MTDTTNALREVLEKYAQPDPKIVGTIQRSGIDLAYVSHSEITRILIEVDPAWYWEPLGIKDGRPEIHVANGVATMWGRLHLLGKTMLGVGSAKADKADLDKELIGDFLRNASMRFGICLNLWSKQDHDDARTPFRPSAPASADRVAETVAKAFGGTVQKPQAMRTGGGTLSEKQRNLIMKLVKEGNLEISEVSERVTGTAVGSVADLSSADASKIISDLLGTKGSAPAAPAAQKKPVTQQDSLMPEGWDEEPF